MIKKSKEYHSEKLVGWLSNFADRFGGKVIRDNNIDPQELKNAGYMDNILDIVNRNKKVSVEEKVLRYRELVGLDMVENLEKEGEQVSNKEAMAKKSFEIGQLWSGSMSDSEDSESQEVFAIIIEYNPEYQSNNIVARFFANDKEHGEIVVSEKSFRKQFPYFKGMVKNPKISMPDEAFSEKMASRVVLSIRDKVAQDVNKDHQLLEKARQYIDQVIKNRDGSIAMPAIIEQLNNYLKIDTSWLREHIEEIKKIIDNAKQQVASQRQQPELQINDLARTDDPSRGEKEAPPFLPPARSTA